MDGEEKEKKTRELKKKKKDSKCHSRALLAARAQNNPRPSAQIVCSSHHPLQRTTHRDTPRMQTHNSQVDDHSIGFCVIYQYRYCDRQPSLRLLEPPLNSTSGRIQSRCRSPGS